MTTEKDAAHWLVLQDQRELTASEARDFAEWLQQPGNEQGYRNAQRSWNVFQGVDDPELEMMRQAALACAPGRSWQWQRPALAAAVLGVLATTAAMLWMREDSKPLTTSPAITQAEKSQPDYLTTTGERLEITLPDGSSVSLNTDSALDVEFSREQRLVRLRRGQAVFAVAKDPARPFLVRAAERQVRATGTVFDVYLAPDHLRVLLAEGQVVISSVGAPEQRDSRAEHWLGPGQALIVKAGAADEIRSVDVSRALRWREGFVEFDDQSLGEAVAEMNRYTTNPVTILDERAVGLRISGLFRTDRMDQFLRVVQDLLPVEVRYRAGGRAEIAGL